MIFGRHDLLQDAPISRLDLLSCRNTLMYLTAESQAGILAHFNYALNPYGYLFLGKAEMLLTHTAIFRPTDLRYRVFEKVNQTAPRDRLGPLAGAGETESASLLARQTRLREVALDAGTVAELLIDLDGSLVTANRAAMALFGIRAEELGRPLSELEISYRPLELRSRIDQAYRERRVVQAADVERVQDDGVQHLQVLVTPLVEADGAPIGVSVSFVDLTAYRQVEDDLHRAQLELEKAYKELQSANEELETTNEELQSTVEELETTNEELESTNSELQTVNVDLWQRSAELDQVNAFLESIVAGMRMAVVVLDADLKVRLWNPEAAELWGLRSEETVGEDFFALDIGLPVSQLRRAVRGSLTGKAVNREVSLESTTRRGRRILCRVSAAPLANSNGASGGVVLLMEETDPA